MSKKGLFEQIADAISRGRWARKDLESLDNRAFKMQGSSKSWRKNSDKMNDQANALQSKAAYNEYLADKLRSDALDKVNEGNRAWNYKLNDWKDKQRMFNAVDEANYFGSGRLFNDYGGYRVIKSNELDNANEAARKLGYDKPIDNPEIAFEDMAQDYYPMDWRDVQEKMNISNSDAIDYLDDGYTPSRQYWQDVNNSVNHFVNDNKLNTYSNDFNPQEKWKAMLEFQHAPARYRK